MVNPEGRCGLRIRRPHAGGLLRCSAAWIGLSGLVVWVLRGFEMHRDSPVSGWFFATCEGRSPVVRTRGFKVGLDRQSAVGCSPEAFFARVQRLPFDDGRSVVPAPLRLAALIGFEWRVRLSGPRTRQTPGCRHTSGLAWRNPHRRFPRKRTSASWPLAGSQSRADCGRVVVGVRSPKKDQCSRTWFGSGPVLVAS